MQRATQRFSGRKLALTLGLAASLVGAPAFAADEDAPTASEMVGDLVVARPFGLAATVLGSAAFVVSLPFSAIGGNVPQAAEQLVLGPAKTTFVRCLGCRSVGRYEDPDR